METYLDMYKRANRYLERIENNHRPGSSAWTEYGDDLFAFFVACYHIIDYVAIEKRVCVHCLFAQMHNTYPSIEKCHDINNGVKHCIRKNSSLGDGHQNACVHAGISGTTSGYTEQTQYFDIVDKSGTRTDDALDVAIQAMDEWSHYLDSNGLNRL